MVYLNKCGHGGRQVSSWKLVEWEVRRAAVEVRVSRATKTPIIIGSCAQGPVKGKDSDLGVKSSYKLR